MEHKNIATMSIEAICNIIVSDHPKGFVFNTTTLRLLSEKTGMTIDGSIEASLKKKMFNRGDGVFFLTNKIAKESIIQSIIQQANSFFDDFSFFELSQLHEIFIDKIDNRCLYNLSSFELFLTSVVLRDVRCVSAYGTKLVRKRGINIDSLMRNISKNLIGFVTKDYNGVVASNDLSACFPAFSEMLLSKIINDYAPEIMKTNINGITYYQTLESVGLSDSLSKTLFETLIELDELGLIVCENTLHTALSMRLKVNFKDEYNISDGKTFRKLITLYNKNFPNRKWKYGVFAEVLDLDV